MSDIPEQLRKLGAFLSSCGDDGCEDVILAATAHVERLEAALGQIAQQPSGGLIPKSGDSKDRHTFIHIARTALQAQKKGP